MRVLSVMIVMLARGGIADRGAVAAAAIALPEKFYRRLRRTA